MTVVLIIVLLLTVSGLPKVFTDKTVSGAEVDIRTEMLAAINDVRASGVSCGETWHPPVPLLSWNVDLEAAALRHSIDMYENSFLSHTGSDGSTPWDRISDAGYIYSTAAENVAWGYTTVVSVMNGWLDSPGHCANIMNSNITQVGATKVGSYWTQNFGKPSHDYIDPDDEVSDEGIDEIADANLAAAIREELNKPSGTVTSDDMASITGLNAWERDIKDLSGIEHLVNLEHLYLSSNKISDLAPLASLQTLNFIMLNDNQITSLEPLSGLQSLEALNLNGNHITDIEPLRSLIGLEELKLESNYLDLEDPVTIDVIAELEAAGTNVVYQMQRTPPGPPGSGEVTGGEVSVSDAIEVLRFIVGLTDFTDDQEAAADVNQDETVNVTDAIIILRFIVGLVDNLPIEQ